MLRALLCSALAAAVTGAGAIGPAVAGPAGAPLFSLNCQQRCELVCEEGGAKISYPASGRVDIFALEGGTQLVRLNGGRWLRLGSESNCLFDGFD
jgi:hypothetical protein